MTWLNPRMISLFVLPLMVLISCEQLERLTDAGEEDVTTEAEDPEMEPEVTETPEIPEWYRPGKPVGIEEDTVYVTVAAVSADSADARRLAFLSLQEFEERAFSIILDEMPVVSSGEGDNSIDSNAVEQILDLLLIDGKEILSRSKISDQTFFYRTEDGSARFYIKRMYRKSYISDIIMNSL